MHGLEFRGSKKELEIQPNKTWVALIFMWLCCTKMFRTNKSDPPCRRLTVFEKHAFDQLDHYEKSREKWQRSIGYTNEEIELLIHLFQQLAYHVQFSFVGRHFGCFQK